MNEADARNTLLLRAFETPLAAPWSQADRDWATREAMRREGSAAAPDRLIAARAALGVERLAQREPAIGAALDAAAPHPGLGALLLAGAFIAGVALDTLGAKGRIAILSPPLLGLLAWNLAVYLLLLVSASRPGREPASGSRLDALVSRLRPRHLPNRLPALARFAADWSSYGAALRGARIVALLHAGAALLALGALASLYLRGLVFEFRAGWDSTFLDATAIHTIAAALYGPASIASGIAVPGADEIARLRFSDGSGENAARWIHLQALTVVGAIVLPRAGLCAFAHARAWRLARRFDLPLADAYYRALLPQPEGGAAVRVLPYSYRFPETRRDALHAAIERASGERAALEVAASVEPDSDDGALTSLPPEAAHAQTLVALFPLTATPERETHGEFVRALIKARAGRSPLRVLVDETDFRARFGAAGEERRAQRRDAWRRMLADEGVEPVFVDLATPASEA